MIKKSYKEIVELDLMVAGLYSKTPALRESKFGYAYRRFYDKNLKKILGEYNEDLAMVRIDGALTNDETGELLISHEGGRGFKYSKDGLKNVIKAERKLDEQWATKEFDVEPYFIKPEYFPEDINDEQKELMKGIVLE